ncbi:MAG: NAD-dependent epimerase/dehydratase family protein [Chloroflexi bacterium]|nr:NAD-dependent epimerase/dehydratase family protein [Chloroflexota bacterium]
MSNLLITGGCGFIGSNLVDRWLARGARVVAFDNLSRRGAGENSAWLRARYGARFELIRGDVRDARALADAARDAEIIFHLAGQAAVTASVNNPRDDFESNALGTFNTLEAARLSGKNPIFVFASTNKVYGAMDDLAIVERATRYEYRDLPNGVSEHQPLDFLSPYGCSKGAADQYVRDYNRIYGLRTVVFRQSAIYGYRQFGAEDQGWLAWFIIAAMLGKPITIFGDGKQVRDMLFIDDLLDAYDAVVARIDRVAGQVYNIGGSARHTISVWAEFGPMLETLRGQKIPITTGVWRPGDQRVCVYDIAKATRELNWVPKIPVNVGVEKLYRWIVENVELFV